MIDDVVASLVKELCDGDIPSALPLIDRLHETGDRRWRSVADGINNLRRTIDEDFEVIARTESRRGATPSERQDGARQRNWLVFARDVKHDFALELAGMPTLDSVRELAALVDPKSIAPIQSAFYDTADFNIPGLAENIMHYPGIRSPQTIAAEFGLDYQAESQRRDPSNG